jgi:hypothetical protein
VNPQDCVACHGRGETVHVRLVPCCSGRNAWGEAVCGCAGQPEPEAFYAPCPRGCAPRPLPPVPILDPYCW